MVSHGCVESIVLDISSISNILDIEAGPCQRVDPVEASFVRVLADVLSLSDLDEAILVHVRIFLLIEEPSEDGVNVEHRFVARHGGLQSQDVKLWHQRDSESEIFYHDLEMNRELFELVNVFDNQFFL